MELIDWIFYWIGRLLSMALRRLGLPVWEMSDGAYEVLGFIATITIISLAFITWGLLND
jgi:hypothetical protein